jgi:CheY-like chemotaxis protein
MADAMRTTQTNALESAQTLVFLEGLATDVKALVIKPSRGNEIVEREGYRDQFLVFSLAITKFNTVLDQPDWLTQQFFTDKAQDMRIRRFQSQSLQMVQSISLIMQAEKTRDILSSKRKLAQQLQDRFFEDGNAILKTKQDQSTILHRRFDIFTWMVIPLLALILSAIWIYMIAPTIESQNKIFKDLKRSQRAALSMVDVAVQADKAKNQFLTLLSHELRTPLNGVIGLTEDLVERTSGTEYYTNAQQVLMKGNELAVLVDEVIALTEQETLSDFDADRFMQIVHKKQQELSEPNPAIKEFKVPANCKILIADDNRTNRLVMGKLVKRMGGMVDIVEDGVEAIKAFKTNSYDLLLLDIAMPNKTGEEAIKAIRAYEPKHWRSPQTPLKIKSKATTILALMIA